MQCSQIRGLALEYALGELGPASARWIEVHAAHCHVCRAELEEACEFAAACERAFAHPRPRDNFNALMARIAEREAPRRAAPAFARKAWRGFATRAAAIAAVAALAALAVPTARSAGEAMHEFRRFAAASERGEDLTAQSPPAGGPIARRVYEIRHACAALPPADPLVPPRLTVP